MRNGDIPQYLTFNEFPCADGRSLDFASSDPSGASSLRVAAHGIYRHRPSGCQRRQPLGVMR